MTRVLHVISGLGTGGAESFLVALSRRLQARGFEQTVVSVTGGGANADKLAADGVPVHTLGVVGPVSAARAYGPLHDLVRSVRPEVIQGWMYHGDLFATLAHRLGGRSARLLWNIRCSDMCLDDYSLQLRLAVRACARLSGVPDVVLANSQAGADAHLKAGYRPRRMIVIPNGIDTGRFSPDDAVRAAVRAELGLAPNTPLVLHVARVDPMKDHLTMLLAAERLEGGVMVFAGKGTAAMNRPPRILGLGERNDVARLMCAGDVIVSSSAYGEGFSNSIAEGMAAGLVPVATDVGDVREIIGGTGQVVPVRDWEALARAIRFAMELKPEERRARGLTARNRIEENFSLDRAAERFEALYRGDLPAARRLGSTLGRAS